MDEARRGLALKYLERRRAIDGWLDRADGLVLVQISALQSSAGLTANLLEIGAYRGKSAILLGYLLEPSERLYVCDTFDGTKAPGGLWVDGKRQYPGLSRSEFDRNYARFHAAPPVVLECPSADLLARGLVEGPLRMVHVDGSYEPAAIAQDIATARALIAPGGVVVFEDDHSLHNPGVAPAVGAELARGELRALCMTPWKLYATAAGDPAGLVPALRAWAHSTADFVAEIGTIAGQDTLLLYPRPMRGGPWRAIDRKAGIVRHSSR